MSETTYRQIIDEEESLKHQVEQLKNILWYAAKSNGGYLNVHPDVLKDLVPDGAILLKHDDVNGGFVIEAKDERIES